MIDHTRFSVEDKGGGIFVVRDNKPPPGSPYKDGTVYQTHDEKLAQDHADHLNGIRRARL